MEKRLASALRTQTGSGPLRGRTTTVAPIGCANEQGILAMRTSMPRTWILLLVLVVGCNSATGKDEYQVISAVRYSKKYPAYDYGQPEIRFTLKHGDSKIVARRQSRDIKNNCGKLEIGRDYKMNRQCDSGDDLLSIADSKITLAVETETLER